MFSRSIGLLGPDNFKKLQDKTIAVIGLGGVGGTALEALARSGVEHFIIIDFDKVDASNLNRQILYTANDVGKSKVRCAAERILSINKHANIVEISQKIAQNPGEILENYKIDYIIDAIDDVDGKVELIKYAEIKNIPIIVSLGVAKRINPSEVIITRLDKTTSDPLAKKLRYLVKQSGVPTKNIMVAFSKEEPLTTGRELNSMMFVPSSAGLNIASYVIKELIK